MQNLKGNDSSELTYKTEKRFTDLKNEFMVARIGWGGDKGSLGMQL